MPLEPEFWTEIIGEIVSSVAAWLPGLAAALLLLFVGWIVARLVQFLTRNILARLGLDRLSERAGLSQVFSQAGLVSSASDLLARLVYWLVLLVFLLAATESLGLVGVVEILRGFVNYLPRVLAATVILILGSLLARLVSDAVRALSVQAGLDSGPVMGQAVRYVLLIFAIILALEQLGIETNLLTIAASAIIGALAIALALAFGLGSRDLARNIMAGYHARDSFLPGQRLTFAGRTGRLVLIGTVKFILETEAGLVSLPNITLIEEEVTVHPSLEPAE
jgi:small-conductance mechanosensitive channel